VDRHLLKTIKDNTQLKALFCYWLD